MLAKSTKALIAALVLASTSLAFVADASARGYQGKAPPWSFACIKDSGPTECGEPMWIYGN